MGEQSRVSRRGLLQASALGGGMLAAACSRMPGRSSVEAGSSLAPIRARTDRIIDITVCLRPFRPAGPRVEAERLGDTLVVHNYGHGGSGWSLSWGSSARAVRLAMEGSPGDVAVIGCGALGLTSAILAQRAGARVRMRASGRCGRRWRARPSRRTATIWDRRARRWNGSTSTA